MKTRKAPWRPSVRILPALPLEILLHHRPPRVQMEKSADDNVFRCSPGPRVETTLHEEMLGKNVYEIRDQFFVVKTPAEAFEFLSSYSRLLDPSESAGESVLSWADFQQWQKLLKQISLHGFLLYYPGGDAPAGWRFFDGGELPEELQCLISEGLSGTTFDWLQGITSHISIRKNVAKFLEFHPDEPPAKFNVFVGSIVEAILANL